MRSLVREVRADQTASVKRRRPTSASCRNRLAKLPTSSTVAVSRRPRLPVLTDDGFVPSGRRYKVPRDAPRKSPYAVAAGQTVRPQVDVELQAKPRSYKHRSSSPPSVGEVVDGAPSSGASIAATVRRSILAVCTSWSASQSGIGSRAARRVSRSHHDHDPLDRCPVLVQIIRLKPYGEEVCAAAENGSCSWRVDEPAGNR